MATLKELEDSLRKFLIEEQSDAYNARALRPERYNNLKIWMELRRFNQPYFCVRISISEAAYSIEDCKNLKGSLGSEERYIKKWHSKLGIKEKLTELWFNFESQDVNGNVVEKKSSNVRRK